MEEKKGKNKTLKHILSFFLIVFFETTIHFLIALILQISLYSFNGLFKYYPNIRMTLLEDLLWTTLGLLGLRLVFMELIIKLILEFIEISNKFKMYLSVLLSVIYATGFSAFFFGNLDIEDIMRPFKGWFFYIPLSVLIVWSVRIWINNRKNKKYAL